MKIKLYLCLLSATLSCLSINRIYAQANTALSNLSATAVNTDLLPGADNSRSLGSAAKGWKQVYVNSALYMGGSKFISYGPTLGLGVTAVGQNALAVNSGFANTGIGFYSLASNTSGNANAAIGTRSLQANTTGGSNMAMGYFSLYSNTTGYSNVAIGVRAMNFNTTASNEIAIGDSALYSETAGQANTAIGSKALYATTNGFNNSAIGFQSMIKNNSGAYNTSIGAYTLFTNTTGNSNTALGEKAMFTNSTGADNTAVGSGALYANDIGFNNTSVGFQGLYANIASNNTMVGFWAGRSNYSGDANTGVGSFAMWSNTTGSDNTAIGVQALQVNTSGVQNTATGSSALGSNNSSNNTADGYEALFENTTGNENTATGAMALGNNTTGNYNTADGEDALVFNTTGTQNTATGNQASANNYTASANTSDGFYALYQNSTGGLNTAVGVNALRNTTNGSDNSAVGVNSLLNNSTGIQNTAMGSGALYDNTTGTGNTAIGYLAGVNNGNLSNASAIGYNAKATASNQIMLGNASIASVVSSGNYVTISDGRFKKNIQANVPGLEFINQLRPVTYNYNIHGLNDHLGAKEAQANIDALAKQTTKDYQPNHTLADQSAETAISTKEKKLYTGFVAQEVEKAAGSLNYEFSGLYKPQSNKDAYGLSYSDFVVPLVKAVQQLSAGRDSANAKIDSLQIQLAQLRDSFATQLQELRNLIGNLAAPGVSRSGVSLSDAGLNQNEPNPFKTSTLIPYVLPQQYLNAKMVITDMNGRVMQTITLSGKGQGVLTVDAHLLSAGSYPYALYVDGTLVGSKQMLLVK